MTIDPYYQDTEAGVTLFHGDAIDILPRLELEADTPAICITDPPYNAGKNYGTATNDRRPWPEWCEWWDVCLDHMLAVSSDVLATLSQTAYRQYVRHGRHEMSWTAVWVKPLSMAICAAPFMPHWEPIAVWGTSRRTKGAGSQWGGDVFTANVEFGQSRWGHPTPKPLTLMRELVSRIIPPGGVVIDPFAGSGTTLRAAKDLGRRAIGIEIEESYCQTIVERLAQQVMPLVLPVAAPVNLELELFS